MLTCNTLRIDCGDGSPIVDYRIENDSVEYRILDRTTSDTDEWQSLTPQELSAQVRSNTVVAEWLRRRMGIHRLLRACNQNTAATEKHDYTDRLAA